MDPGHAIFRRQDKGFRQIVAGDDLAVFFRPVQKFLCPFGGGGVVHVENTDDGLVPHGHVVSDG